MAHPAADLPIEELTVDERLTLLGRLWDSLLDAGPPPVPAWHREEVRRRMAAADADPTASIPLEELRRQLRGNRP
jgi:putative addiction module component (TIGR02574 family)